MEGGQTSRGGARKGEMLMGGVAQLTGWPTPDCPRAHDSENTAGAVYENKKQLDLAKVASWATPRAADSESAGMRHSRDRERMDQLPRQAFGVMPSGSPAGTAKRGQLNPGLSRWLQGLPIAWDLCAPKETASALRRLSLARKAESEG
jgi:hypothetical protein